jgi:hypothetical protein
MDKLADILGNPNWLWASSGFLGHSGNGCAQARGSWRFSSTILLSERLAFTASAVDWVYVWAGAFLSASL